MWDGLFPITYIAHKAKGTKGQNTFYIKTPFEYFKHPENPTHLSSMTFKCVKKKGPTPLLIVGPTTGHMCEITFT